jgi:general secretion pathway protein J
VKPVPEAGESGFTLIELMISMGLFALIAVAGLALVDGIIKVQDRTEGRLDRLTDIQRSMYVVAGDLDQIASGRLTSNGANLTFNRAAPGLGGAAVQLRYILTGGQLVRSVGSTPQLALGNVTSARWRFWDGAWSDRWPINDDTVDKWPRAVSLDLQVANPGGAPATLRRVVALPTRPQEQKQ